MKLVAVDIGSNEVRLQATLCLLQRDSSTQKNRIFAVPFASRHDIFKHHRIGAQSKKTACSIIESFYDTYSALRGRMFT